MNQQDIIGVWRSGGQKVFSKDGSLKSAREPSPGYIIYTNEGRMMVVSTTPEGLSNEEPARMSAGDKARAADCCVAYSGPFEVKNGVVYHHVDVALFPAWVGDTRVRHASLEGRRMTFVTEPNAEGAVSHIYWDRV